MQRNLTRIAEQKAARLSLSPSPSKGPGPEEADEMPPSPPPPVPAGGYVPSHRDPFQAVPDDINNTARRQSVGERRRSEIIGQHHWAGKQGVCLHYG
ncbi:hypothetical protein EON64_05490 [archaeon]|nr:MAG: hypothetical protein EON64_05490 [archaeon]